MSSPYPSDPHLPGDPNRPPPSGRQPPAGQQYPSGQQGPPHHGPPQGTPQGPPQNPPQGYPHGPGPGGRPGGELPPVSPKGFFGALFDFSFNEYVTSKVIKVLYVLGMVLIGLSTLFMFISGLTLIAFEPVSGILFIFGAPLLGLVYLIMLRIWLELLIVIFKIGADLSAIRTRGGF